MTIHLGDCVEVLAELEECSVDCVVTDPPYGLSEHTAKDVRTCMDAWLKGTAYRPRKRGYMGHNWDAWVPGPEVWIQLLRVMKPGAHALVFAGSRTQDLMGMALRLSGFEIRDTLGWMYGSGFTKSMNLARAAERRQDTIGVRRARTLVRRWQGLGTSLKPSCEPIILARKPLDGTVIENMERWGVGALSIQDCAVPTHPSEGKQPDRQPANMMHDGSDEATGPLGPASRFFYCAKATRADREDGLSEAGLPVLGRRTMGDFRGQPRKSGDPKARNSHPTVKPVELMRYLVRLVSRPGQTVLDPFCGSGSTGKAAVLEFREPILIERDPIYADIARARVGRAASTR